jgi:hypothetical protein
VGGERWVKIVGGGPVVIAQQSGWSVASGGGMCVLSLAVQPVALGRCHIPVRTALSRPA